MFDFLSYKPMDSYIPEQKGIPAAYMRILQLSLRLKKADVYSNGHLIGKGLGYKKFTPYFTVPAGYHFIEAFQGANRSNSIANSGLTLKEGLIYTVALLGDSGNTELHLIEDAPVEQCPGTAHIRFANLYSGTAIGISKHKDENLLSPVKYKDVSDYITVPIGKYVLDLIPEGSEKPLSTICDAEFKDGWNYTIYASGVTGGKPCLHAFVLLDGSTYIKF